MNFNTILDSNHVNAIDEIPKIKINGIHPFDNFMFTCHLHCPKDICNDDAQFRIIGSSELKVHFINTWIW